MSLKLYSPRLNVEPFLHQKRPERAAYFSPGQRPGLMSVHVDRPQDNIQKRDTLVSDEKNGPVFSEKKVTNKPDHSPPPNQPK